jgi:hypothetical protein
MEDTGPQVSRHRLEGLYRQAYLDVCPSRSLVNDCHKY